MGGAFTGGASPRGVSAGAVTVGVSTGGTVSGSVGAWRGPAPSGFCSGATGGAATGFFSRGFFVRVLPPLPLLVACRLGLLAPRLADRLAAQALPATRRAPDLQGVRLAAVAAATCDARWRAPGRTAPEIPGNARRARMISIAPRAFRPNPTAADWRHSSPPARAPRVHPITFASEATTKTSAQRRASNEWKKSIRSPSEESLKSSGRTTFSRQTRRA